MNVNAASAEAEGTSEEASSKRRVTLVGALVNALLAVGKVLVGVVGHSQALVADGVHSLSDLASDAVVLFAAHSGSKDADEDHPYGHARFETAATVAVGVILLVVAGGFVYDAIQRLLVPARLTVPGWYVLPAAVVSVLAKEGLYWYTIRVGRRMRSRLIEANAWHHRSDAASSLVVIAGVAGTMAGIAWFDAAAAIVVALMVGVMGWQFGWVALRELVDTGLDQSELETLGAAINAVDGVRSHHQLRSRYMGDEVLIDVHIRVDPTLSVTEGHRIGEEVHAVLAKRLEQAGEVLVHVDAERLTGVELTERRPPLRSRVLDDLRQAWRGMPEAEAVSRTTLHYRGTRLFVEVELPAGRVEPGQLEAVGKRLFDAAADVKYLAGVRAVLAPG